MYHSEKQFVSLALLVVPVVQKYTIGDLKNRKGLGTRVAFTAKAGAYLFASFFDPYKTNRTTSIEYIRTYVPSEDNRVCLLLHNWLSESTFIVNT